jgi:hypothetical protein
MYAIKATKKLLDRMQELMDVPVAPSTKLGNWFAKPLFWRPQYALFVSETIYVPVIVPLAPASRLAVRFPDELALTLRAHGVPDAFIERELLEMDDVIVTKTDSRQVVGVMNEFARMAARVHELHADVSALQIAVELAGVPVGISGAAHLFPVDALHNLVSES